MIESPLSFFQIEMEVFFRNTAIMIEPMFGIGPEALDAVDVISSLGSAFVFADDHMIPSDIQEGIGMPIICVIETARLGVSGHQRDQFLFTSAGDGKG